MSDILETINKLSNLLTLTPATKENIDEIELDLALNLADDYKECLLAFGAVMADNLEMTGYTKNKNRNVVLVTEREWALNANVGHDLYVIENLGIDGIIIWQDASGKIYETKVNGKPVHIADNLANYLRGDFKKTT